MPVKRKIGCILENPFLQLSFLALPVIPALKITDQGLIDVENLQKIEVFASNHLKIIINFTDYKI